MVNNMDHEKISDLHELMDENIRQLAKEYFDIVLCKDGSRMYSDAQEKRIVSAFENVMSGIEFCVTSSNALYLYV